MPIEQSPRLRWIELAPTEAAVHDIDIIQGLQQVPKTLPCRYFYDDRGSALFEQICDLPEYYPTRTEQAILEDCALEIAQMTGACELVELGSGSSRKTRLLLEAYQQLNHPLYYAPIDVSAGILQDTAPMLLRQYPTLNLCGLVGTYEQALSNLPPVQLDRRMLIFLGSTLGNLNPQECDRFFTQIQQSLQPGDFFLLGVDLQKPIEIVEAAYNDAQGITAEFNLNILHHLNDRFQGNFAIDQFAHSAFYNVHRHQIEMHLISLKPQKVLLQKLGYQTSFYAQETIHTEISRKFDLPTLTVDLKQRSLNSVHIWTDPQKWFALLLCQRQ
ncbi:L-histidine N(alpha)-methyltransferase [Leptolyngbya sp. FACHB-711]|uniref:L-histidine N(alpha)-methyltransferase n=1 Tax=unclassified Leptolyngbya TaxID=2650499 RepID=UPI001683E1AD|nr:L-histidine N(alpha)-methyltransferase [Leptolyngbya sp. FACHB-711]MBD1849043.1 L-histidine N(alpha)-methyltransferase [Cyanobacteria bacterium FACHB-502]MBD2023547.1 L-histidine N(alpha)-methyltransferase [Leptolyngbya sp. FACHB-711]